MHFVRQAARDQSGAAAVEFAIISLLFLMTLVFIMVIALIIYFGQALDYATNKASRQIMTGQVQNSGISQTLFRTQVLCPFLPGAMTCDNVIISVQTVATGTSPSGYYAFVNSNATALIQPTLAVDSNAYSVGGQGSYEYVEVLYPVTFIPSFFAKILGGGATFKGSPAYLLTSTTAFKNEQYN